MGAPGLQPFRSEVGFVAVVPSVVFFAAFVFGERTTVDPVAVTLRRLSPVVCLRQSRFRRHIRPLSYPGAGCYASTRPRMIVLAFFLGRAPASRCRRFFCFLFSQIDVAALFFFRAFFGFLRRLRCVGRRCPGAPNHRMSNGRLRVGCRNRRAVGRKVSVWTRRRIFVRRVRRRFRYRFDRLSLFRFFNICQLRTPFELTSLRTELPGERQVEPACRRVANKRGSRPVRYPNVVRSDAA